MSASPAALAPRRVLVISLAGAGDTLMATPLLRELRAAFPAAAVDVLTMQGAAARQVLAGNACVTESLHHDFMREPKWKSVWYCLRLRRRRYDLSFTVMPQNRFEYNLITRLIGARERVGFEFEIDCGARAKRMLTRTVREKTDLHLVENNLRLFTEGLGRPMTGADHALELTVGDASEAAAVEFLRAGGMEGRRLIGFHPGSGTTKNLILKRWPADQWAELAARVGREREHAILLFGSPDELPLRRQILEKSGLPVTRITVPPSGSVQDTAALIRRLAVFVCGDTLLTHVAAAMQTPTVEIMGPTPPASTGPYRVRHRIVRLGLACSPCYGYAKFGIHCTQPVHMACLKGIDAARVEQAVRELLAEA